MKKIRLVNARTFFTATLIVVPALTLIIYFSGLGQHRSLYLNSLLSTSILSAIFLVFITTGLYQGWKLKDDVGNYMHRFDRWKKTRQPVTEPAEVDSRLHIGHGWEGCLVTLLLWIVLAFFGAAILWWISAVFWAVVFTVAGMLYWIIFRAYRLIFKNSAQCKGDLIRSFKIGLLFTILYNCWIYAIIFGARYLSA